jgi:hypothetical protein
MQLTGTPEQQLVFLNMHWGRMYEFTAPDRAGGPWTAQAKFGNRTSYKRSRPQRCCSWCAPTTPRRSSQDGRSTRRERPLAGAAYRSCGSCGCGLPSCFAGAPFESFGYFGELDEVGACDPFEEG